MFNAEKLQEIYNDLLAQKQVAIDTALARKEDEVNGRLELLRPEIEKLVEKELVEEAIKPFEHDIALFEKALVIEVVEPEIDPIAE